MEKIDVKKRIPARLLLEQLRRQRRLIEDLDFAAAQCLLLEDRQAIWNMRTELLKILMKDLSLKKGVIP